MTAIEETETYRKTVRRIGAAREMRIEKLSAALTEAVRLYERYDLVPNIENNDPSAVGRWINQARDALK